MHRALPALGLGKHSLPEAKLAKTPNLFCFTLLLTQLLSLVAARAASLLRSTRDRDRDTMTPVKAFIYNNLTIV